MIKNFLNRFHVVNGMAGFLCVIIRSMFVTLFLTVSFFIRLKLQQAGINPFTIKIFTGLAVFSGIVYVGAWRLYSVSRYFEIIYAILFTVIIIFLFAFMSIGFIELLTGFSKFTRTKLFIAIALTCILSIYSMLEAYFVRPVYINITTKKLPPEIPKIRITYLTDVHLGGVYTLKHFERVMQIVNNSKPDIFILAGDIVDGDMTSRTRELELLSSAAKKAKYGAFAVNGNHEYYHIYNMDVENIIREQNFNYLIDERFDLENLNMAVIGFDDKKFGWLRPYLKDGDENRFVLLIKHRPGLPHDAENRFDLQISGHTHNGQFWPMGYFKNISSKSTQGFSQKAGGYVYVSNGAGFNGPMMRFFAPPEVTIIDITRE